MVRPFRAETERYGHYSVAGEFVYDHPFLWGSKRTGPDLQRVGGRYSDEWHRLHLMQPARRGAGIQHAGLPVARQDNAADARDIEAKMRALRRWACRTPMRRHRQGQGELHGKTETDALIAYLQGLGTALKGSELRPWT